MHHASHSIEAESHLDRQRCSCSLTAFRSCRPETVNHSVFQIHGAPVHNPFHSICRNASCFTQHQSRVAPRSPAMQLLAHWISMKQT
eukprot:2394713-Rhodomonas_salina.1